MKRTFKKVVAVSLMGLALTSLAGCNKKSDDDAHADSKEKLHWFSDVGGYGPVAWKGELSPLLQHAADEYGVEFEMEAPPSEATTKLGLMIASGDLPDFISVTDDEAIKQLVDSDKVWKMEDFLKKYDPDSHLLTDFPEDIKQAVKDKYGDWYSIPSHMDSADNRETYPPASEMWQKVVDVGSNSAILVNEPLMKEAGITKDDLKTEQGFYDALKKVKAANLKVEGKEVVPLMLHGNLWQSYSLDNIIAWDFGAVPVDADGNYIHRELSPGYKNALKFVNNNIRSGALDVNSLTIDEAALKTYVADNRVFCLMGNSANFDVKPDSMVAVEAFKPANGATSVFPKNKTAGSGWLQTMVSKDCANPEGLAKFISFATSKDGLTMNIFGNEGDYTVADNGTITPTAEALKKQEELYDKNMGLWNFSNVSYDYNVNPDPAPGSEGAIRSGNWIVTYGSTPDIYTYDEGLLAKVNDSLIEASSDLGIKNGQVKSYLESQKGKIVSAKDDATFEKEYNNMINTLNKKYAIDKIDEVYNKEYQAEAKKQNDKIEDVNASLYK